ncbi:uncharacterized protein HaLaN_13843, partial [Haematococcus lacustris]
MVRGCFTRVTVLAYEHELLEDIPAADAPIPDFAERNLFLQLSRGLPPPGINSRPSAAVEDVLTAYPDLHAELDAIPRYPHDINTVDDVGQKLEISFANSLTELFKRRVGQAVALAGARVIAGSHEHQRRFGLPLSGRPAWTQRERSWVERSVRGKVVTWLQGQGQGQGGVVPTEAMRYEVARQRRLLGVGQGVVVNKAWRGRKVNSGAVESVWQRSLSAGQYYRQSGITQHTKTSKAWMAGIQHEHAVLSQVTNYTASLQRYREYVAITLVTWPAMWAEMSKPRWSNARFRLYGGKQRTVAKFWAEVAAPGAQHGDAIPDPGPDVLNKHRHQVLRSGRVSRAEHP